ncbi:hypothetical protein [Kitasatospora sp. NPDC058046]|uniref:hypothetical protein n=1 Tax=Kitasatospora sp. NPDC058046 TaxID=3346312 RepID=UPI0036D8445B
MPGEHHGRTEGHAPGTPRTATTTVLAKGAQQCEESQAHNSLPMVTGSKEVHEIPVIGKFWPQGDPKRLRGAAQVWAQCASVVDTAQRNAGRHAAGVMERCTGAAFEGFASYAATVFDPCPPGGTAVAASQPLMVNISAARRELQAICEQYAQAIESCQDTLIGLGVAAGVVTTAGVVLTLFTFGASDAAAAVAEAEAVVSSLASRLVVLAGTAAAASAVPAVTGVDSAGTATPSDPAGQQPAGDGTGATTADRDQARLSTRERAQ